MRLVHRLTLVILLVVGMVLGVDAYVSIRAHLALFQADIRSDERQLGRALAHAVERVWQDRGEDAAREVVRGADARQERVRIRLVSLDQPPKTPEGPDLELDPDALRGAVRSITHIRDDDERVYTYAPLSIPSKPFAALELSESIASERAYMAYQVRNRLLMAAVLFFGCAIVAWRVGVQLVGRPVEQLVDKARRIGAGDFSRPLAFRRRDEFSLLADEMNAMATALATATRDLAAQSAARIDAIQQLHHADRLATVGKLASGLAHELGTPLNVVSGRARMIADGEIDRADETAAAARIIAEQAERMTRIVRQLLDFARLRAPERRDTDLAQLVHQVAGMLAPLASQAGVSLRCDGAFARVHAAIDPEQIRQAVTNLVMNAIQAARSNGCVTLGVRYERSGAVDAARDAVVEVADDGIGIPAENLRMIFDPFFTTKPVGEGTGLGLAVAHGIVMEHGGRIEVKSENGCGSVFRIRLVAEAA
jgi:signal transduction histidine kinase